MAARREPEVVVVGAGLSGLAAALCTQAAGRRTWILERRSQPGGLCGTQVLDGREFPIACNTFGRGLAAFCRRFGVALELREERTRLDFERGGRVRRLELPLSLGTALRLLPHAPALRELWRHARQGSAQTLDQLLTQAGVAGELADWLAALGYPFGLPPARLPLDWIAAECSREQSYGYAHPTQPLGGPGVMAAAFARRFEELGGEIRYGCEVLGCERASGAGGRERLRLRSSEGELAARAVITSEPRFGEWPADARPGLEISTLQLGVSRALRWPTGTHTLSWFPAGIADWLGALDAGEEPPVAGFQVFESGLDSGDELALSVHCFLPRGMRDPDAARRAHAEDALLSGLERLLPGFGAALRYRRLLAPADFERLHGLSCAVIGRQPPPGLRKPEPFDSRTGLTHVGHSVGPPGDHAGQALRSGEQAARAVLAQLAAGK